MGGTVSKAAPSRSAPWNLDASAAYYLFADRHIEDSQVRQINPTGADRGLDSGFGLLIGLVALPAATVGAILGYHASVGEPAAGTALKQPDLMVAPAAFEGGFGLSGSFRW